MARSKNTRQIANVNPKIRYYYVKMAEGPSESELSNAIRLDQSLATAKIPVARWQRKALETSCNNSSLNGTSSGVYLNFFSLRTKSHIKVTFCRIIVVLP